MQFSFNPQLPSQQYSSFSLRAARNDFNSEAEQFIAAGQDFPDTNVNGAIHDPALA